MLEKINSQMNSISLVVLLLVASTVGFFIGKLVFKPVSEINGSVKTETLQGKIVHESGAVTASRETQPIKVVKKLIRIPEIPLKSVERVADFQLSPRTLSPINIQLITSKDENQGHRITIKADNADVTKATEFVIPYNTPKILHWNAKILYELTKTTPGTNIGAEVEWKSNRASLCVGAFPRSKFVYVGGGISW